MTAPPKPWEGVGPNLRQMLRDPGALQSRSPMVNMPANTRRIIQTQPGRVAPPIPARGAYRQGYAETGNTPGYGGYGGGGYGGYGGGAYGSYGGGAYGGYGGGAYGGYGSYGAGAYGGGIYGAQRYGAGGYGMNRHPLHQQGVNSLESRFIQMAEASSRPAFESIESLVQAFGSVSFMMESTFHAMYGSFRAVLGVAENFGRLRSLFGQVFQTFAVLRLFQWMYRKLLYYLGIRPDNPGREAVWRQATGQQLDPKTRRTFWPVAMFLGLVCGGPFLVWRLLRSINVVPPTTDSAPVNTGMWITNSTNGTLPVAMVHFDFTAARDNELTVKRGQCVWVAPPKFQTPDSDWLLVSSNWKESGLVPANFIEIVEHRQVVKVKSKPVAVNKQPAEIPASAELSPEIKGHQDPLSSYPVQDIDPMSSSPVQGVSHTSETPSEQKLIPIIPAVKPQTNDHAAAPISAQQYNVAQLGASRPALNHQPYDILSGLRTGRS